MTEPLGEILVNSAQNLCVAARAVTPLQSCNKSAANPSQRLSGISLWFRRGPGLPA